MTPQCVKPGHFSPGVQLLMRNGSVSRLLEGKGCVTGLVPEDLSQPPSPELLRRLQKGTILAARFPHAKPST